MARKVFPSSPNVNDIFTSTKGKKFQWNGKVWKGIHREGAEVGWAYVIFAIAFVLLPTAVISIGVYLFPPISGSFLSWLPLAWTILTFAAHLFCVVWLIIEYYQFPIFLYIRALKRKLSSGTN